MRRLRYIQLDVFTAEPFRGNQLAVFFGAESLAGAEMQAIAREMNFSESTFILPADDPSSALRHVRIFTPGGELPFAGHPVIGTTVALARAGHITAERPTVTLELGVGPLSVTALFEDGEPRMAWMDQPLPVFTVWDGDRAALLDTLGLDEAALRDDLPIERGSAGVPYVYIPLRDLAALGRARPGAGLAMMERDDIPVGFYLFVAPEPAGASGYTRARMFAPEIGVVEDAATGSAAGPLGVYLARHGLAPAAEAGQTRITVAQGVEMGRRSLISVALTTSDGAVTAVRVGGGAVVVAEGQFFMPDQIDNASEAAE